MTTVRLLLPLVAGLLLATPGAIAAPARGELEVGSLRLAPDATLEATQLDLLAEGALPALELVVRDAEVHRLGQQRVDLGEPADIHTDGNSIDERASYATATLRIEGGADAPITALRTLGAATGALSGADVRGVGGALLAQALASSGNACGEVEAYANYCLDVFGVYEMTGDQLTASLTGPFTLLLYGPSLVVDADGAQTRYASGVTAVQGAGPAQQTDDAWVVVTGTIERGTAAGDALRLFSAAPTFRTSAVTLRDAQGELRVGLTDYRAASDDVEAAGAIVLSPAAVPAAADHGVGGETVYANAFSTRISGDVASIDLDGAPAFLDSPAERAGAAAILVAVVGAVAYAWNHLAFAFAALYTRLNKPDILDNDVRNRIYDIIVANPGISAREVHRQSDQSWGTVVYHLRQLERHHLVVSRALGRTRNYYENHGKYRGMEVQLACLQSDRALALAREIATSPGITQEQLAEKCQFPQPTTSYYVRKLKQAGLVEEQREGRYVKYVPHADLPRFVALASHQPQVGAAAATGVQA